MDALNTEYVGSSEASRALGVSSTYVRKLMREGRLGHIQTPLGKLIPKVEVERLVRERAERKTLPRSPRSFRVARVDP